MKTFYTIILGFLFCTNSFATLTVGNVPVTKTGGSTPVIQNSDITDTGGNVGVGSTNPGQQLDVNGTIRATVLVKSGGTSSQFLKADGSVDSSTYSTATGANPTATVGTSSVNGSSANFMRADGAPAINLTMSPTWTGNHTFSPSSGDTLFNTGNVGIGSPNPLQPLDVLGSVRIGGNVGIGTTVANVAILEVRQKGLNNNAINSGPAFRLSTVGTSALMDMGVMTAGSVHSGYIQTTSTASSASIPLFLQPFSPVNAGVGIGTYQVIGTNSLSTWGGVAIGSNYVNTAAPSNGLMVQGNVGVGSTLPGFQLDVNGTVRMTGFNLPTGASNTFVLTSDASGNGSWAAATGAGTVNSGTAGQNAYYASSTNAVSGTSDLIFNGNDSYFSSGNVGIGTTQTANAALTVMNGNIGIGTWKPTFNVDIKSSVAFLHVGSGTQTFSGAQAAQGFFFENAGNSNGNQIFETKTANGVGLTINNSGNIGIGTWLQNAALAVMSGNVGIGTWIPKSSLDVKTSTNVLIENGNVGIGSTLPGQMLDVFGTIRISQLGGTLSIVSGSNACRGQSALSSGTVTVSTACAPASSDLIYVTDGGGGTLANIGSLSVGTVTSGTSFVCQSSNALDSSNCNWLIINKT